jgi:rRNA-processing protein FCF1
MEVNWLWGVKGLSNSIEQVLIDSSFILACVEKGKDLIAIAEKRFGSIFKPVTASAIIDELKLIASKGGKRGRLATLALEIVNKYSVLPDKPMPDEDVDNFIVRIALEKKLIVATNDVKLRSQLRKLGVPHLYLRYDGNVDYFGHLK